ncbi:molecular chaperone DnaJ [Sphingorhabdus lutea]|uniref:Molecular chaperone DnaJ n=1 Tax=Sphingorhabdus lutea TaxID=1913578 RepID=A0A1L3JC08_9SPHN|nr:J domain-containing protein [Sphingorhabdus lutea]APG62658.1 molecular chaperone DnaJ [Sphingorhabdus lutea]
MARIGRKNDWGFPRWRGYGSNNDAQKMRICDRHGCDDAGVCPAPKSPNSPERWMFCATHAAEYNKNWDYFAGLSKEEAEKRRADEQRDNKGYKESSHYGWAGSGDGSRSADEMRALEVLGLESHSEFEDIKKAWRRIAKETHPDVKPGDKQAEEMFKAGQLAFEVLRAADERRSWNGPSGE